MLKINQLLHKSNSEATLWDIVLFLAQIWHINNTLFYCLFLSPYLILFGVFFCALEKGASAFFRIKYGMFAVFGADF